MNTSLDGDVVWPRAPVSIAKENAIEPTPVHRTSKIPSANADRLSGIDAARGIAMIMVCVSHVRHHFHDIPALFELLTIVSRVATPTFLLLSGFVAAYVLSSERVGVRTSVIDRGMFVLIVGHLLLNGEELPQAGWESWLLGRVTVTDAIGVCLIVGALCAKFRTSVLLIAGMTLAAMSWPVAISANADSSVGQYLLITLFNARSGHSNLVDAAIVPYLGLFLIGMALSRSSIDLIRSRNLRRLAFRLFVFGIIAIVCVVCAVLLWRELKDSVTQLIGPNYAASVRQALNPMQKLPPSPGYLMFYGGAALMIASACLALRPRVLLDPLVKWTATLGRASLMCFVVQDWLLKGIPTLLGFDGFNSYTFWIIYFTLTVLLLHWLASRWDASRSNRFLTVGLKALTTNKSSAVERTSRLV